MSNYPPGTWAGDPRAPWNAPDPDLECDECGHRTDTGDEGDQCDEDVFCEGRLRPYVPDEPCRCPGEVCRC